LLLSKLSRIIGYAVSIIDNHVEGALSKNKYIYKTINGKKWPLHKHIMEEHLLATEGRTLEPNEHVYHKDGDSKNNEIGNLVVIIMNKKA
jgi:hypothetical protein